MSITNFSTSAVLQGDGRGSRPSLLTLVFDAFSRMPLGFTLRYDPPCTYSVLCAIFDCVLRQRRFADSLADDQGPEFESRDLGVALAYLRAAHIRRPKSNPRFGALIERQFGSLKTRVVDELSGSVDTVARSRELTSTHDPQRHALWTLPSLSKLLEAYFFERYPKLVHGELGAPPRDVFEFAMAQAGERVARYVAVDETLSLALSETVPGFNGCRRVPKRGGYIRVGYLDFHHPDFSDARVAGRSIPVRRSPSDATFVYVLLPHRSTWERARVVAGSVDVTQCSWRASRALMEEYARQRLIAELPSSESANAKVMSGLLLSVDEYEREAQSLAVTSWMKSSGLKLLRAPEWSQALSARLAGARAGPWVPAARLPMARRLLILAS